MHPTRLIALAGLLGTALAACQPPPPPEGGAVGVQAARWGTGAGQPFRERLGWSVEVMSATAPAARAYCLGLRNDNGLGLVFIGGEPDSGFRIVGLPDALTAGASETVLARFDHGERRKYEARVLPGSALEVVFPTIEYDHALQPFARAHSVTFEGQRLGPIGRLDLEGSSWAVNATDECRRMNVPG